MVKTGFRPSDDPNDLAFNIPGNAMLATYLQLLAEVLAGLPAISVFRAEMEVLRRSMGRAAGSVREAILSYGVVSVRGSRVFAYEVNGKGEAKTFDDANLPSLLSLSYLQFVGEDDPTYLATRKHILSSSNPYFYQDGNISGIGSSHTPPGNVWPLALITQILTSQDAEEMRGCLASLQAHSNDNLIHESFSVRSPTSITRPWFAWANSLFG
jgi:uncharacterized protein